MLLLVGAEAGLQAAVLLDEDHVLVEEEKKNGFGKEGKKKERKGKEQNTS